MRRVLITGASRGIGLEHARQFAARGWVVHACARNPDGAIELQSLAEQYSDQLRVHALDVIDHGAIEHLAVKLAAEPLDILLNNAGTFGPEGAPAGMLYQSLRHMDYDIWREILEVNLLAPFRMAVAFREHLSVGEQRLLVMMSSGLASIEQCSGQSYAYRSSKAGLNMVTRGMAAEWRDLIVVAMAPGWCRTELGGAEATLDPVDSVRDQQTIFAQLKAADSGRFIDQFGESVPW